MAYKEQQRAKLTKKIEKYNNKLLKTYIKLHALGDA